MIAILDRDPELYLDEIQDELYEQHNVDVSLSTIYRTLKRLGYSSKKVCTEILALTSDTPSTRIGTHTSG